MRAQFCIDKNHPALEGHFPGNPVVPAALILEEVAQIFLKLAGKPPTTVQQVRFLASLKPGQIVTVSFSPHPNEGYRFSCQVGDQVIVKGVMTDTPCPPEQKRWELALGSCTDATNELKSLESIYRKLPHAGSMQLLSVGATKEPGVFVAVGKSTHSPLQSRDSALGWTSLEYAAQAFACNGLFQSEQAGFGSQAFQRAMVTRLKTMRCYQESFETIGTQLTDTQLTDTPLVTVIQLAEALSNVARCDFSIYCDSIIISAGQFDAIY